MSKDDDALFEEAMANLEMPVEAETGTGVGSLGEAMEGIVLAKREVSVASSAEPTAAPKAPNTEALEFARAMAELEVPVSETVSAQKRAPRRTRRELERAARQGRLRPDITLDLHGLTEAQAWSSLERCVVAARRDKRELLQVICGRGLHSQDRAVLLEALQAWLRGPLQEHVLTSFPSSPGPGGRGAWFLVLRG